MSATAIVLLVIAVVLVLVAGVFAMLDAALQRLSKARVDELLLLATHGVLHLLGYDHMEPDEEKEMFGLQSKLLEGYRSIPREPVTGEPMEPETR